MTHPSSPPAAHTQVRLSFSYGFRIPLDASCNSFHHINRSSGIIDYDKSHIPPAAGGMYRIPPKIYMIRPMEFGIHIKIEKSYRYLPVSLVINSGKQFNQVWNKTIRKTECVYRTKHSRNVLKVRPFHTFIVKASSM